MQHFTRRSARVEAMRLETITKMRTSASPWLAAYGLSIDTDTYPARITGPGGECMTARLGQWLAYNPDSGEFTVWDEEQFRAAHSEVSAGV